MYRALLCACSDYRDPAFTPLKYPLNDIEAIRNLLEERELCDFEDIEVLANPGKVEAHEALERLTADSDQDDLILFYFSGHGKLARDGSVALVLNDTKENRLYATGLLDDQLRVLFNASRARQRVIILDCCYSGAVGEEGFRRVSDDAVEAMAHQIKGTFILAASTKFQPAMECAETEGGAFTSCLIEGVRTGAAAEKDTGCVTLAKLGEYLVREVPRRSNQHPKFWDFGGVGGTVIARVPASFDAAWIEQTLKRLRQMMAREQIDDTLFVDLQRVLRSPAGSNSKDKLGLIDDLAQRRLKPIPFLRKWQKFEDAEEPKIELEKLELEKLEQVKLEREKLEQERLEQERLEQERLEQERLEQERLEQERLEQEKLEKERLEQERLEQEKLEQEGGTATGPEPIERVPPDQPQPPSEGSPEPVESPEELQVDAPPYSRLMDNAWRGSDQSDPKLGTDEANSEQEAPDTSRQIWQFFDFLLVSFSLLVGPYVMLTNIYYEGDLYSLLIAILFIALWVRLWHRIEGVTGRIFLSLGILASFYICANNLGNWYDFFPISGAILVAFSLVLAFLYWRIWRDKPSQT